MKCKFLPWTQIEDGFLLEYYPAYGGKYCAMNLKRSQSAIRIRASKIKIKRETAGTVKVCSGCLEKKSLLEFSPHKTGRFGVQNRCKKCRAKWESNRKKTDKDYRLEHMIRNRIRMAIKTNVKSGRSLQLLGCSIPFLKTYIANKFKSGMVWENWGKWHLDHIIPCCCFDLSKVSEQQRCFHYSNLQPLWAKDNLSKSKCHQKCNSNRRNKV